MAKIPFSILDLATVAQGRTIADAFHDSLEVAQAAEALGYHRYWFAEHHNSVSVGSAATSVLIGYIAQGTKSIRVGSGGIMLPNHSPYIIAEQFGTLATLYPNRVDLGLGRAPGTDQLTAEAIGRQPARVQSFAGDIEKLQHYFAAPDASSKVRAIPGEGLHVPLWVLGSSLDSARLAASMGLPYAFASHFSPTYFLEAIALYRKLFKPSGQLSSPYVIACVNVVAAETDQEAERLFTSLLQMFLGVVTGRMKLLQPPADDLSAIFTNETWAAVSSMLNYSFVGGPEKLKTEIDLFIKSTGINEIMTTTHIYDHAKRLRSHELFAELMRQRE